MRYDPAPLRARMRRDGWVHTNGGTLANTLKIEALARHTPWTKETVRSLVNGYEDRNGKRAEGLTWWQADRLAVALGCHPVEIWGESWLVADDYKPVKSLTAVGLEGESRADLSHPSETIAA